MNIPLLRVLNQQLLRPQFCDPAELVSWMGGIQAQDLHWMKWALGVRLRSSGIDKIDKALKQGEILRLHIMRPTWHFVAARDIRWMLKLSTERIERAYLSYARSCGLNLPAELPQDGPSLCSLFGPNRIFLRQTDRADSAGGCRSQGRHLQRRDAGGKMHLCSYGGTGCSNAGYRQR